MKQKILVVDDEPDQILTVKYSLNDISNDYEVIGGESGNKLFKILENEELPDVILLDIMIPEIDGLEIFKKLKENSKWEKIPVIFVTARSDKLSLEYKEKIGNNYIEKPFEIIDLKTMLDKILKT